LSRGLGDSGLGTYSLFFTAILVAAGIANLGVGLGNIYFLNKGTHGYRVLLSNSVALIGWTALAGWLFVGVWAVVFEPDLFVSGGAYWSTPLLPTSWPIRCSRHSFTALAAS
jgi:hypothetical protein